MKEDLINMRNERDQYQITMSKIVHQSPQTEHPYPRMEHNMKHSCSTHVSDQLSSEEIVRRDLELLDDEIGLISL